MMKKWIGEPRKWLLVPLYLIGYGIVKITGISCVWQYLTGFLCPGCGMTRAVLALLRLDITAAFRLHPMVFTMPVLAGYFLRDGDLFRNRTVNRTVIALIGFGFLTVWLIRLLAGCDLP